MKISIAFKPDATALCLWTEAVPLHEFDRLEFTRATNIEFDAYRPRRECVSDGRWNLLISRNCIASI